MKSESIYSLKQERLWAERQQAIIRMLLSLVTSVVLIKFYSSQGIPGYDEIPKFLGTGPEKLLLLKLNQVVTIIALFMVYSVGMWVMVKYCPDRLRITTALGSLIEIGLITYLFATTAWTGIPFYLWYFFYVVSIATRYGWLHSILALSASIVSFTWVAAVPQNSASDVVPVLGFTGFLLVLAMMFGQISERQLSYQASLAVVNEFRGELAGLATSRDIVDLLLKRVGQLLNVEQTFFLPAKRGADGSEGPGLRSAGTDPVLLATFREGGGIWNVEDILREQHPLVSNNLSSSHPLPEGMAAKLGIRNMAAAPLVVRGAPVGVVYAANRRDKSLRNSDLQLLGLVASQAAPVVENALLWERLTEAATSEERLRIARDLHDNFLQTLAAIKLHLERCKILVGKDSERAKEGIDKIHQIATRGLAEVRYYLSELRLMGPEPSRFREAIVRCADEAAVRGSLQLDVDIELPENPIPPGVAVAAFQIVRELLNNVVAHAQAHHATVRVKAEDERLVLEVEDDGVGFEVVRVRAEKAAEGHLGLVGIEERASQANGALEVISEPGKGTKAIAWLAI
jgi:signal transduction histidine kinase